MKFCLKGCNVCGGSLGYVYNYFHIAHIVGKFPACFEFFNSVNPTANLDLLAVFEYSYGISHNYVLLKNIFSRKNFKIFSANCLLIAAYMPLNLFFYSGLAAVKFLINRQIF